MRTDTTLEELRTERNRAANDFEAAVEKFGEESRNADRAYDKLIRCDDIVQSYEHVLAMQSLGTVNA